MEELKQLLAQVNQTFVGHFGRTPLAERVDDILRQAMSLSRYTDLPKLHEEAGDLLASALQLVNETGWEVDELVHATLDKITGRAEQYHQIGRRLRIALLGGAFDPITNGHIHTAQHVLNTSRAFDEVWLMPCYQHMHNKPMELAEHRLAMCRLAAQVDRRIQVFDYEIAHRLAGETFFVLKTLLDNAELARRYEFALIIGQDNANTLPDWVNGELVERMIPFVVVQRAGWPFDPRVTWYLKPPHLYLTSTEELTPISSTKVREILRGGGGNPCDYLSQDVQHYIHAQSLYGTG
jgi:nicotinate-nucleotide adenylyltransferase